MWNNQLETAQESKIVLKTRADKYEEIKEIIEKNCSYEVPEITFMHIDGGNDEICSGWKKSTPQLFRHD